MLSDFLYAQRGWFKAFNVFHYVTFRSALGALGAFAVCYWLLPWWIALCRRRGWGRVIRSDGPSSHGAKAGTPTMGGLIAVGSVAAGALAWAAPANRPHLPQ